MFKTCVDLDERARNTQNCEHNATCINTLGGITYACNTGFSDGGVTCL